MSEPERRLNGSLVVGGRLAPDRSVVIRDGRIVTVEPATSPRRRRTETLGSDEVIAPGFVDVHVHGGVGVDVMEGPAAIRRLATTLAARGVTSFMPTSVSAPLGELAAFASAVGAARRDQSDAAAAPAEARVIGAHLEGPAIDPGHRGAHDPAAIVEAGTVLAAWRSRPQDWNEVAMMTLAPERSGGLDLVRALVARHVVASIGHTGATFAQAKAAYESGASSTTHLFNAMTGLTHRAPGVVGAALVAERATAELIADGLHVDQVLWPVIWRILGPRLLLVSDGMAATGLGDGVYPLGARAVTVVQGRATTADGVLAGSTITVADAVANLVEAGLALPLAVRAATLTPSRLLDRRDIGRIAAGARADLVVLDRTGRVRRTMIGGRWLDDMGAP